MWFSSQLVSIIQRLRGDGQGQSNGVPLVRPRQLRPGAGDAEGEGAAQPRHSCGGTE